MTRWDINESVTCSIEENTNKSFTLFFYKNEDESQLALSFRSLTSQMLDWEKVLNRLIFRKGIEKYYKSIKKIGEGNFANVYLSARLRDNKKFAVKAFSKESLEQRPNGLEALYNEIRLQREFDHPNIVKLEAVHDTKSSVYVVLELVEGKTL